MLRVESVDAYYGLSHVLQGVSLTVEAGEAVALLGRNGAGKTTTLKTIMAVRARAPGPHHVERRRHHGPAALPHRAARASATSPRSGGSSPT